MTTALTPEQRIAALEAELAKFAESECDKIMAMSEEQITALTRMQGSNPDDVAKIGRMACDLALKDVAIQRLEAELAACRQSAEDTAINLRAERDTARADLAEVRKNALKVNAEGFAYQCRRCLFAYNCKPNGNEDCPKCGFNGIDAAMAAQEKV